MESIQQSGNQTMAEGGGANDTGLDSRTTASNITIIFFFLFIIVIALAGNILVILAVYLYQRLQQEAANLFIVNLSITDLGSAVVVMISTVTAVSADRWVLGHTWCLMVCGANYCFIIVSMLTLCFISLDRYMAINYSLRYNIHVTRSRVLMLNAYAWLQGVAFGSVPVLYDWIDYDYWEAICAIQWHRFGNPVLIYVIVAFIVCFCIPGIALTVAYYKVFDAVKNMKPPPRPVLQMASVDTGVAQRSLSQHVSLHQSQSRMKYSESAKAVRSLLIVVVAYFICMTPFSVTKLYKVSVPVPDALPGYVNLLATFFQYIGSAVNPLIYGLFRRDFQKAFMYLIWRAFRQRYPNNRTQVTTFSVQTT